MNWRQFFLSWLTLIGWLAAFCINCLMIPLYMIPYGFAGGIIFLLILLPIAAVGLGIIYFGCRRVLTTKRALDAVRYVLFPTALISCMSLFAISPLAESSRDQIYDNFNDLFQNG